MEVKSETATTTIVMPKKAPALYAFFANEEDDDQPIVLGTAVMDAFEAMMEGVGLLLDLVDEVTYVYTTKSGNKIRGRLDSP